MGFRLNQQHSRRRYSYLMSFSLFLFYNRKSALCIVINKINKYMCIDVPVTSFEFGCVCVYVFIEVKRFTLDVTASLEANANDFYEE